MQHEISVLGVCPVYPVLLPSFVPLVRNPPSQPDNRAVRHVRHSSNLETAYAGSLSISKGAGGWLDDMSSTRGPGVTGFNETSEMMGGCGTAGVIPSGK